MGDLAVRPDMLNLVLEMFEPIKRRAMEAGLTLSFENCGQTPDEVITFLDALKVPNWGMAFDCANMFDILPEAAGNATAYFTKCIYRANMIHVKARATLDAFPQFRNVHWERILRAVSARSMDMPVSIETHNPKGSPFSAVAMIMVYNKGVYRELGLLDENERPTFTNSMESWQAAAELVESNYDMFGTGFDSTGYGMTGAFMGLYYQLGGEYEWLGDDGLTDELDTAIAVEALNQLAELYAYNSLDGANGFDMLMNQMAPCTNIGTWSVNYAIEQAEVNNIELGFCPYPVVVNPDSKGHLSWSHSLFLPKNENRSDEVTKAALEFVTWFLANNEKWAQAGHLPANGASYETEYFKSLPMREEYQNAPAFNQAMPSSPAIVIYTSSEFNTPVEQFLRGGNLRGRCGCEH